MQNLLKDAAQSGNIDEVEKLLSEMAEITKAVIEGKLNDEQKSKALANKQILTHFEFCEAISAAAEYKHEELLCKFLRADGLYSQLVVQFDLIDPTYLRDLFVDERLGAAMLGHSKTGNTAAVNASIWSLSSDDMVIAYLRGFFGDSLKVASRAGFVEIVSILVNHPISIEIVTDGLTSAIEDAEKNGHENCADLIRPVLESKRSKQELEKQEEQKEVDGSDDDEKQENTKSFTM